MRARLMIGLALVVVAGCGSGRKLAPVSGRVTLDGKALVGATVSFQPIADEGALEAGIGSQGKTNENGEFTLSTATGESGAFVGKHLVRISLINNQVDLDKRPPRGGWPQMDLVPSRYNSDSEETFDVLPGGTDKADFPLVRTVKKPR